jgi:hypothetical protein
MEQITKFYKTQLEKEILIAKLQRHPSLYMVFKKKKYITQYVKSDIKIRIAGEIENFATIFITGQQGSMKSSVAIEIAMENDPTFCVDRICQTYQEFKEKLEKSNPKEWFILDEQVFMHGIGSGRIIDSIQTLIETLRQRQNSMIIISPEKKYFPEDLFTYTLETIDKSLIGECPETKEAHDIRTCEYRPHINIDAVVRTAVKKDKEYIGFYVQEIHWETPIWKAYYKKKILFNQTILREDFQKIDYRQIAIEIANNPKSIPYKTSRQIMLFLEKNYPNFSVGEKGLLIEEIKIRRKMNQQPKIDEALL